MDAVTIPVIASSGAGAPEHFSQVFEATDVQAVRRRGVCLCPLLALVFSFSFTFVTSVCPVYLSLFFHCSLLFLFSFLGFFPASLPVFVYPR